MPISKTITQSALSAMTAYWQEASQNPAKAEGHLAGVGAVAALETKLKAHYGKAYALCVSNATMGLFAVAVALNLKGVEFVTTPYTYGASLAGFLWQENRPIFSELELQTLTLNPESVRQQITPNTKAILAVDILGNPCDTIALRSIADEYGLWYIADAAQSLGSYRQGMPGSKLADAVVVSFTVGKSVFAGEGGAILTDSAELYQKLVWLTQHPHRQKRDVGLCLTNEFALNARIHPLAAIIANATFEASLQQLRQEQDWYFQAIAVLNQTGLTESIEFQRDEIVPSFFRFCAAWRKEKQERELLAQLRGRGFNFQLQPLPLQFIPAQSAFQAQYAHLFPLNQDGGIETNVLAPQQLWGAQSYFCLNTTRLSKNCW